MQKPDQNLTDAPIYQYTMIGDADVAGWLLRASAELHFWLLAKCRSIRTAGSCEQKMKDAEELGLLLARS